jgi:cell division protein FtsB
MISGRRGSVPAGHTHTPHTAVRSANNGVELSSSPPQGRERRGSRVRCSSKDGTASVSAAPLTYTEAELSSMSPAQLRRQLKVASAATQRLHRRTQQLQKEVEQLKERRFELHQEGSDLNDNVERSTKTGELHTAVMAQDLRAAEERAERLQKEMQQLSLEKEALTQQLHDLQQRGDPAVAPSASFDANLPSGGAGVRNGQTTASPTPQTSDATAVARDQVSELTLLRDTVRQLQGRLEASEECLQRATQLQLDALLQPHSSANSQQPSPTVTKVDAEVQQLFELMQAQLLANAAQQQVERTRMNELFYQLERQRGLM